MGQGAHGVACIRDMAVLLLQSRPPASFASTLGPGTRQAYEPVHKRGNQHLVSRISRVNYVYPDALATDLVKAFTAHGRVVP